ncbi:MULTISPECIES: hypothetical protein [Flavobacterium]|jgi:hypothetical protein|uniref:Uncharacterized protein n=2 Tax=Flavobacterium TaxID=237 RepID=A0A085ZZI2_FLAHY|nr:MULTISPECIES: hypothetical protein [Flavobacterium]KFF09846.1 hypothetical protein IW20_22310 [Flavobacterium hydatis]MDL2142768.1 hypothetical protein [Flavobacterium tructae]OHT43729.1 hypothetical protein BHE19_15350 [Flavobacterium tructae]OXA87319.1 hypothetical protein B0A62_22825 [Flavobacterium hydatis]OXB20498.1 hypothetical protein B0A71_06735 [Flavobacterium tructae]
MNKEFHEKDIEIRKELEELIENGKKNISEIEKIIENNDFRINDLNDPNSKSAVNLRIVRNFVIGTILFLPITYILLTYVKGFNEVLFYFLLIFYSLLIGLIFWFIRKKYRLLYGLIELSVGVTAIFIVLQSVNNSLDIFYWKIEKLMSFVGGVYILVRGIDNISVTNFGKKVDDFLNFK